MTEEEQKRYARQIAIPEIGAEGQEKLAKSRVLLIGAGGLGSPAAYYLAAAGIGTLGIADGDTVEISNLQRQILHHQHRIGMNKALSARKTLEHLNSGIRVAAHPFFVDDTNIRDLIRAYDIVIDASDQRKNKLLINDACVLEQKPFVHGGITGFSGQVMTYVPGKSACCRCIFGDLPREITPAPIPVIGVTAGIIGTIEAAEAIKVLLGIGIPLAGKLLTFDGLRMQFRTIPFEQPAAACPVCNGNPDTYDLSWYRQE